MTIGNDSRLIFMETKGKMLISLTSAVKCAFDPKEPSPLAEAFILCSMTTIMSGKNVHLISVCVKQETPKQCR